jgi:methylmalonyl-CoA mutase N-terminal domain/subunit
VRARRDAAAVERTRAALRADAAGAARANLMPALLDCARAHASEGEIVRALQDVFGTYRETPVF